MEVLIIDNNILPPAIADLDSCEGIKIVQENFKRDYDNDVDLDTFVSNRCREILTGNNYDLIVLPYHLSDEGYHGFLGLKVCAHIRLTEEWGHTRIPFLFIGPDYKSDVIKYEAVGSILNTAQVYTTKTNNSDEIIKKIRETSFKNLTDQEYEEFLDGLSIKQPVKVGRHSIANQWGVDALARSAHIDYHKSQDTIFFQNSLFFKFILAKSTNIKTSQEINDNVSDSNTQSLIKHIESRGRNVLLIDDEADRGWESILRGLLKDVNLDVAKNKISEFDALSEEHIKRIEKDYYDLYLLDLRLLGDEEENVVKTDNFSGMNVLENIMSINKGNQVIILTASNKAWNMKGLMKKGAVGYYIKESPELMFPKDFSEENFNSLKNDIETAFKNKFKREIWADNYYLKDYIEKSTIEDELKDLINSQLGVFNRFMLNISNEDDMLSSCLVLFQVFEIIKQYYSKYIDYPSRDHLPDNLKMVLEECGHRIGDSFFQHLKDANLSRNKYIHKLPKKPMINFKSSVGLRELFNLVSKTIKLL